MKQKQLLVLLLDQVVRLNENLERLAGVRVGNRDPYDPVRSDSPDRVLDQIHARSDVTDARLKTMLNNLKRRK
jgi:hypothetical protein